MKASVQKSTDFQSWRVEPYKLTEEFKDNRTIIVKCEHRRLFQYIYIETARCMTCAKFT